MTTNDTTIIIPANAPTERLLLDVVALGCSVSGDGERQGEREKSVCVCVCVCV